MDWSGVETELPQLPGNEPWQQTVARLGDERRVWTGLSNHVIPGKEVADLLTRTLDQLKKDGWGPDTSAESALFQAAGKDIDVCHVAIRLLNLMVAVRSGSYIGVTLFAFAGWEGRRGRTFQEVSELLNEAISFARVHGAQGN